MSALTYSRQEGGPGQRLSTATCDTDDSGSVATETALALLLLLLCVASIMAFSVMIYTYSVYQDAARYGARYATLHGADSANCSGPTPGCGDPTGNNVVLAVQSYASPYVSQIGGMSIQVNYPDAGGCKAPSRVIVTVSYTYVPLVSSLSTGVMFTATSQGRIIY